MGNIDLDEETDVSYAEQLATHLKASAGKVLDLFREWDENGDGEVSRKEFHGENALQTHTAHWAQLQPRLRHLASSLPYSTATLTHRPLEA